VLSPASVAATAAATATASSAANVAAAACTGATALVAPRDWVLPRHPSAAVQHRVGARLHVRHVRVRDRRGVAAQVEIVSKV